ncbi:hypothetical protein HPB49_004602 [Dermacentor silvarum]|uniref:Uncharacterized protein n=1 Tax=Dermacentor silvarum TaxID=543639 RepID=A0ACB8CV75_DERSI|nr:hypothetical protein HPB49_004602 [Dermacentor silvarum]
MSAAEFAELDESEFRECPVDDPKNTVLAVCYTSGSTGMPKGTEMTHYNCVASFYTSRLQALVREMRRISRRMPSVKRIIITGSVLSTTAADAAREAFDDGLECMLNMYGMTESCSAVTAQPRTSGTRTGSHTGVPNTMAMLKRITVGCSMDVITPTKGVRLWQCRPQVRLGRWLSRISQRIDHRSHFCGSQVVPGAPQLLSAVCD